ncbi:hypothetical protein PYCCODRAFT_1394822 [Trametes coccinea BRFM310]|uniref:Uncharacterized protein n=1 Tax=Trametes coccinea (strain BRFM310) TaxID=1353009 RepID=A0A1Y2II36_TRAC3|nr:hypothetical protein PYCCODRAFT_1394822 [Trametes coccinea BRFM310]
MIAELERKLAASQDDLISTRALLQTKSAELRDAQVFLTRVDDASDGEVVNLIGLLNSSIFQTSANIAAKFQPAYGRTENRTMRNRYIEHLRSSQLLSRKLLSSLDCLDHHQNPIVVQFALQAIMAFVAQRVCFEWILEDCHSSRWLDSIYTRMRGSESQTTCGRWRALGRIYVGSGFHTNRAIHNYLAGNIVSILLACGIPGAGEDTLARVRSDFGQNLCEVVEIAMDIRRISGERIISRDLFPSTISSDTPFQPERMDDEWHHPETARSLATVPTVLCTTHLGLVSSWMSEASARSVAGGKLHQETILLKPKVVLSTTLEDLQREQHRGRARYRSKRNWQSHTVPLSRGKIEDRKQCLSFAECEPPALGWNQIP